MKKKYHLRYITIPDTCTSFSQLTNDNVVIILDRYARNKVYDRKDPLRSTLECFFQKQNHYEDGITDENYSDWAKEVDLLVYRKPIETKARLKDNEIDNDINLDGYRKRLSTDQRQLELPVSDNYFCRSQSS